MRTINIHHAKTQLSRLVEEAAKGDAFIIAKAGRPMVRVTAIDAPKQVRRIGFMDGRIEVPDDFDAMGRDEIAGMFSE